MCSLDVYKKLKEELNRLLSEGDNLNEEDKHFINFIANSNTPKGVLNLVKELKEEGNELYKQSNFDEALEKYGFAGVILSRVALDLEEDVRVFHDLASCVLLNLAACLSKKKDFIQVGHVCSIVLDFNPSNVKALFRRAMAAIELHRRDLAFWDLKLASSLDPSNKEIAKKLKETEPLATNWSENSHPNGITPLGLGLGLSSPKRRGMEASGGKNEIEHCQVAKAFNTYANLNKLKPPKKEQCLHEGMREESQLGETVGGIMDANMEDGARLSPQKNSNQAEPKYWFVNRRRPGSNIFMSRKDYLSLKQGKSYHCFNSNQGSFMSVQIVSTAKSFSKDEGNQGNEKSDAPSKFAADQEQPQGGEASEISENSGKRARESQETNDTLIDCKGETSGEGIQNRVVNDQQPNVVLCRSSNGSFLVALNPEQAPKKLRIVKARRKMAYQQPQGSVWRSSATRRRLFKASTTQPSLVCRYRIGGKRKDSPSPSQDYFSHPRKKRSYDCLSFSLSSNPYFVNDINCNSVLMESVAREMVIGS